MRFCISSLVAFLLLSGGPVWAAISHDATSTSAQTNVTNPSYTHTRGAVCANPIAVITVTHQDSTGTISSVTYNGSSATQIGTTQQTSGGNSDFVSLWRLLAPPSGGSTVQANFSETINDVVIATTTYCGVDQTTPLGTAVTGTGTSTTITINASSASGELVVDAATISGTRTLTVGAGQTQRVNNQTNHRHVHSDEPGAATTTMSWAISSTQTWATIAVPLKPATDVASGSLMLLGVGQ